MRIPAAFLLLCGLLLGAEREVGQPFWISTPPGAGAELAKALDELSRPDPDTTAAAQALQAVFDRFAFAFTRGRRPGAYVGAHQRAREYLAAASTAVRARYEQLFGPPAEELLRRALRAASRRGLLEIVRRYEATRAGLDALLALADRALLHDKPAEARLLLRRIGKLHPAALATPGVEARIALAAKRDRAEGGPPPSGEGLEERSRGDAWPMLGGNPSRTGMVAGPVLREERFSVEIDIRERLWDQPPQPPFPRQFGIRPRYVDWDSKWKEYDPVRPVVARGTLVYGDGPRVEAVNLYTGERIWAYPEKNTVEGDGRTNLSAIFSPVVAGDAVYAAVEVAVDYRPQTLQGIPIVYYLPRRRLVALDLDTGEVKWRHDAAWIKRHPDSALLAKLTISGVPLVRGGHLYVAACSSEGTIRNYLLRIDRFTGELDYATRISNGQQELNLFGRQLQECVATPVAESGGVLYYGTNLGIAVAVDALLGTPIWAVTYSIVPIPSTYYWYKAPRRWPLFDNGPPLVTGDLVILAPTDATHVLALDRITGRVVWRIPWRIFAQQSSYRLRVLQGVDREHVYLSGPTGVFAFHLKDGRLAWTCLFERDHVGAGHGLVAKNGLWIPTYETIYRIDRDSGKVIEILPRTGRDAEAKVHLVWSDAVLITAGREFVCARYRDEDVMRFAKRLAAARPGEVGPLLTAADIQLATGHVAQAIEQYRTAGRLAEAGEAPAHAARAAQGLFRALLRRAERTFDRSPGKAPAEFEAAFRAAPGASARLRARLRLENMLAVFDSETTVAWRLRNLRALEEEPGDLPARTGEGSVRAWAFDRMAAIEEKRGKLKEALATLQRLVELDPAGEAGRRASRRIRELIEEHGRALYASYEARARRLFDAARQANDLEALERGLLIYANASAAAGAALELARRHLAEGDAAASSRVLQRYLAGHPGSPRIPEALILMVRALHAHRSFGPAYAALLRLRTRYGDALVSRADGAQVRARDLVESWLAREPYREIARSARRLDLAPRLKLHFKLSLAEEQTPVDVPEILGHRPESLAHAVLVRVGRRIAALDTRNGNELFSARFTDREPKGPLVLAGNRMHAVTDRYTYVFDAKNGRRIARREVPEDGRAARLFEHRGQVFLLYRQRGLRGRIGIAALHPDDGSLLWKRQILARTREPGISSVRILAQADHLLVCTGRPVSVLVIDTTSGVIENSIPIENGRGVTLAVAPVLLPDGRLLLGLGIPRNTSGLEYKHTYELALLDPASPAESAISWRYKPPADSASRYLRMLRVIWPYAVALDEARGVSVVDLTSLREVRRVAALDLGQAEGENSDLYHLQPRSDSLFIVLTQSRAMGDAPARLLGFELPDLRPKYALELTAGGDQTAELVPAQGVVAIALSTRRRQIAAPRIRLYDPLSARALDEIVPDTGPVDWFNASVQNGRLIVTTSTGWVYGYGPR